MGVKVGIESVDCPVRPAYVHSAIYPNWRIFCNFNCIARQDGTCSGDGPETSSISKVEEAWSEYKEKNNLDRLE